MRRTLFILAGPPGAGKSTLLQYCLVHKLPLFCGFSEQFYGFTPLDSKAEEEAPVQLNLQRRRITHMLQLLTLDGKAAIPDAVLMHLDIFRACAFPELPYDYVSDHQKAYKIVKEKLDPLFKQFDQIYINSIVIELLTVAGRFLNRPGYKQNQNCFRLYSSLDKTRYDLICQAWMRFAHDAGTEIIETKYRTDTVVDLFCGSKIGSCHWGDFSVARSWVNRDPLLETDKMKIPRSR
jgi:hypothetical protein